MSSTNKDEFLLTVIGLLMYEFSEEILFAFRIIEYGIRIGLYDSVIW